MILLINICKEKLHYYEFVKPIEDILKRVKIKYFTKHYNEISNEDLKKADKIIICGTSLKDNKFIKDINKFKWIKGYENPVLGICGGIQIIGLMFNGSLRQKTEIGFYSENLENFLGIKEAEVYHLHNNYVVFSRDLKRFTKNRITQAVKHNHKKIYGVLFHPEVRQKNLIINFCSL